MQIITCILLIETTYCNQEAAFTHQLLVAQKFKQYACSQCQCLERQVSNLSRTISPWWRSRKCVSTPTLSHDVNDDVSFLLLCLCLCTTSHLPHPIAIHKTPWHLLVDNPNIYGLQGWSLGTLTAQYNIWTLHCSPISIPLTLKYFNFKVRRQVWHLHVYADILSAGNPT